MLYSSVIATPGPWSKALCSWSCTVCIMIPHSPVTTSLYSKAEYMATGSTTVGKDSSLTLLTRRGIITSVTLDGKPRGSSMLDPLGRVVTTIPGNDGFWPSISNLSSSGHTGVKFFCCNLSANSNLGNGIGTIHALSSETCSTCRTGRTSSRVKSPRPCIWVCRWCTDHTICLRKVGFNYHSAHSWRLWATVSILSLIFTQMPMLAKDVFHLSTWQHAQTH